VLGLLAAIDLFKGLEVTSRAVDVEVGEEGRGSTRLIEVEGGAAVDDWFLRGLGDHVIALVFPVWC
jgi:hypothetical protein